MSWLNLNVSSGGKAANQPKALLDALLRRQQEREAMRVSAERAARAGQFGRGVDDDGNRRRATGLRDEPIAYRPQSQSVLGVGIVTQDTSNPGTRQFTVYSGNGQASHSWSEDLPFGPTGGQIGPDPPPDIEYPDPDGNPRGGLHSQTEDSPGYIAIESEPTAPGAVCEPAPPMEETLAYHAWRSGEGSEPRTFNEKVTKGLGGGISGQSFVVLPVGGDRFIYARRYHQSSIFAGFWAIRLHVSTVNTVLVDTQVIFGACLETRTFARYDGVFSNTTRTGSEPSQFSATAEKCLLVSYDSVKEISMPAGLRAKMLELVPDADGTTTVEDALTVFTDQAFLSIASGLPRTEDLPISLSVPSGPSSKLLPPFSRFGLSGGTTAGVYEALNNLGVSFGSNPILDRAAYSSIAPLPNQWLFPCAAPSPAVCDTPNGVLEFGSANATPTTYGFPTSATLNSYEWNSNVYRPRGPISSVGLDVGRQLIYSWDWDSPAYCREKLLELGFSASDLQP
jgi:hypothetical protein